MASKPIWSQVSPRHVTVRIGERHIDLRYRDSGFQSAWEVHSQGRLVHRQSGFLEARGLALALATGGL